MESMKNSGEQHVRVGECDGVVNESSLEHQMPVDLKKKHRGSLISSSALHEDRNLSLIRQAVTTWKSEETCHSIKLNALRASEVAKKLSIAVSTVWLKARTDPEFPKPIKLYFRVTVFLEPEVDAYIISCALRQRINGKKSK
jgi:prophage regulatory protein